MNWMKIYFLSDHTNATLTLDITRQVLGFPDIKTELISKVWSGGGEDKIKGASAVIILLVKIDVSICY